MRIFRGIFLICISLVFLSSSGCYMSKYRKAGKTDIGGTAYHELRPFGREFEKALYKAHMSVNGWEFDGLLMIKQFAGQSYKVAFFSELGLNFFDFGLRNTGQKNKLSLNVNHIYPPLDRSLLLNNLEKYFSMLLSPGLDHGTYKTFVKKDGSKVMIQLNAYKGKDAYLSKNLIGPYTEIVKLGPMGCKEKIRITVSADRNNYAPDHILIEQAGLRLRLEMQAVPE
ncbi:MAG: hypothetical protein RQ761_06435 [Bacteroidales bacterium]|nr:hypothetical protein [Bacteroidales bacterium]